MGRPLRIGVNALYLIPGGVGGTEIYLRSLLGALAQVDATNEYFVFTNRETGTDLVPAVENFHQQRQDVRARVRPARLLWEQTALPWRAAQLRLDVLFNPGFTAPIAWSPCPSVTVFHDLQHKRHPQYFRWFDLPFWRFFLYWAARRSSRLIAVSEATRADLLRYYPMLPESRIAVVPHGVDPEFFAVGREARQEQRRRFVLCVSTLHPHKNLDRLVRAFRKVHAQRPEFRLVIAGMHGFQTAQIEQAIIDAGLGAQVHITGWIPREELLGLYGKAWAFVYPSTFEGFGMPVLEALAAGLPGAVSAIEPMRSIAGNAAVLFDPMKEEEITAALLRVIEEEPLRQQLREAGPERASQFSWRTAAGQTLRVLEEAAAVGAPAVQESLL
jgi:glycosyltransferase involved in cell wall biosynthesis